MTPPLAQPEVQIDDGTMRVTRWNFPPRGETGPHRHEFDYVVVPIMDGTLIIEMDGQETVTAALVTGVSYNRSAGVEHNVVNGSDEAFSFVEVELLEHPG